MFYDSSDFKALEAGTKLTWMQQQLSLQNIANSETPGYKAQKLEFSKLLDDAASGARLDARVVESNATSNRSDGNNVDLEAESVALYRSYAQYSAVLSKVKSDFDQYNYVLNSNIK